MGEQLSLKAAMPLAEILATCRKNVSNTGPWNAGNRNVAFTFTTSNNEVGTNGRKFVLIVFSCSDSYNFPLAPTHYSDDIMSAIVSQITGASLVWKHQSPASLAFVRGIHLWPMDSPHKRPVTRKMFPFDDVIMEKPVLNWGMVWNRTDRKPFPGTMLIQFTDA